MSPEAQRIAIAEACGWRSIHDSTKYGKGVNGFPPDYTGDRNQADNRVVIPDYLNDLNAIRKVVLEMDHTEQITCLKHLGLGRVPTWNIATASAPKWCKAYIKTLNLWEDAE